MEPSPSTPLSPLKPWERRWKALAFRVMMLMEDRRRDQSSRLARDCRKTDGKKLPEPTDAQAKCSHPFSAVVCRANQYASWKTCSVCKWRLSYTPKERSTAHASRDDQKAEASSRKPPPPFHWDRVPKEAPSAETRNRERRGSEVVVNEQKIQESVATAVSSAVASSLAPILQSLSDQQRQQSELMAQSLTSQQNQQAEQMARLMHHQQQQQTDTITTLLSQVHHSLSLAVSSRDPAGPTAMGAESYHMVEDSDEEAAKK